MSTAQYSPCRNLKAYARGVMEGFIFSSNAIQ
jgi:hypothetical protein